MQSIEWESRINNSAFALYGMGNKDCSERVKEGRRNHPTLIAAIFTV